MPRRTHYLKANHSTRIPQNLLFVDTESHGSQEAYEKMLPQRLTFRLGHAIHVELAQDEIDYQTHYAFDREVDFWHFHRDCERKGKPLWMFTHNLHHDLTQLQFWHQLETMWFRVDNTLEQSMRPADRKGKTYKGMLCLEDSPCFARILGKRGTCWFVDSLNYFPISLKKIGKLYGIEPIAFPGFDADDATMKAYCRNDAEILMACMLNLLLLWEREDCGNWKATAAGCALANYQHWHADNRAKIKRHTNRFNIRIDEKHPARNLEREGYRGGRIEAFFYGKRPIEKPLRQMDLEHLAPPDERPYYLLDVRSLYPAMMAQHQFPCARKYHLEQLPPADAQALSRNFGLMSRCLIDSGFETYPYKHEGRQVHASGRFVTTLCGRELVRALELGHVLNCGETCVYELDWLFQSWAVYWWEIRLAAERAGDVPRSELAKLILNSLSGKFAQKPERWQDMPGEFAAKRWGEWKNVNPDDGTFRQFRAIGGWVQERVIGEDGDHVFPAISAFITAAAREFMRTAMKVARPENVFWIGTDALIVNRFGFEHLERNKFINSEALGCFAMKELSPGVFEADQVEIIATNAYRIGEYYRSGGLWGRVKESGDQGNKVSLWQRIAATLSTRPDGSLTVNIAELGERTINPKGELHSSGWVAPMHFDDLPVNWSKKQFAGKERPPIDSEWWDR